MKSVYKCINGVVRYFRTQEEYLAFLKGEQAEPKKAKQAEPKKAKNKSKK